MNASLTTPTRNERTAPSRTVLVVDDDHALRNLAALILKTQGFETFVASNGLEALQTLERNPHVDVVLLDLLMPVMNGEDAFRAMRATWPEVAVIIISGFDATEVARRLGDPPPDGFVQKPFSIEKLTGLITAGRN